ncbi:hypothetical protein ACS15_1213 [Ralstonia insidiosa]|uniref:Uncharacterized protein n=1 Tax=Ralstonia insidiosa TaxID=190721 RepID=A0AAC9FQ36_9RALS|nr:hypothetical protein ACS15_1213 [Ralstonia insidiosa]
MCAKGRLLVCADGIAHRSIISPTMRDANAGAASARAVSQRWAIYAKFACCYATST